MPRTATARARKQEKGGSDMLRRMQDTKFKMQLRCGYDPEPVQQLSADVENASSDAKNGETTTNTISQRFCRRLLKKASQSGRIAWVPVAIIALAAPLTQVGAQSYTIALNAPSIDKWQYPFGGSGATRTSASTFGAVGSAGFDNRDAEFFNAFDTSGIVPKGLGAGSYQILSATFTLSIAPGPSGSAPDLIFDGTYDPLSSFGTGGDDPGRPMELFGAAFRNGFSSSTITETTEFGGGIDGKRNIYPTDFQNGVSINGANRDVSNNVTNGFEVSPFAIGQVASGDLSGGKVDLDADVVFTLNLANPDVLRYLQLSLDEGRVSFLVTSLHSASQGGPVTYPIYYTKENLLGGLPARLDIQVQVVPEPGTVTNVLLGFGVLVAFWRTGRAFRDKEVIS